MKLWSKGLGKLVLPFDIEEAEKVYIDGDFVVIEGKIVEKKVNWNYEIKLDAEDMVRFIKLMVEDEKIPKFIKKKYGMKILIELLQRLGKAFLISPIIIFKNLLSKEDKKESEENKENKEEKKIEEE